MELGSVTSGFSGWGKKILGAARTGNSSYHYVTVRNSHAALFFRFSGAEIRPVLHECPSFFEHITAAVSGLDLVSYGVCERHLRKFIRVVRLLGRPVLETRADSVRDF